MLINATRNRADPFASRTPAASQRQTRALTQLSVIISTYNEPQWLEWVLPGMRSSHSSISSWSCSRMVRVPKRVRVNGCDERMQYGVEGLALGEHMNNAGIRRKTIRCLAICMHPEHPRSHRQPGMEKTAASSAPQPAGARGLDRARHAAGWCVALRAPPSTCHHRHVHLTGALMNTLQTEVTLAT